MNVISMIKAAETTLQSARAALEDEARFAATPAGVGLKQALRELNEAREQDRARYERLLDGYESAVVRLNTLRSTLQDIANGHGRYGILDGPQLSRKDMRRIALEAIELEAIER